MRFTRIVVLLVVLALAAVPVASALRFTDDDFDMPIGQIGTPYSKQFAGGAGCGPALPYQFRILDGSLPPGISLSKSGLFSGTPTVSGSWSFWVELSDQDPPSASWCRPKQSQRQFTISVVPRVLKAETDEPFRTSLPGSNWSLAAGTTLPDGLVLDPGTGVLSGEPTSAGPFTLHLVQTNAYGWKNTVDVGLNVATKLSFATASLRAAKTGKRYVARLEVTGGIAPYLWTIVHGALPTGIRLNRKTGMITGVARHTAVRRVTVRVEDNLGALTTGTVTLKIVR